MKVIFAVVLVLLVLYGSIGAVHMSPMDGGLMSGCPFFMPSVNLCDMTPLAHLAAWQDSFIALTPASVGALLVLALLALLYVSFSPAPILRVALVPLFRVLAHLSARRELQDAFSNGILNPKIF